MLFTLFTKHDLQFDLSYFTVTAVIKYIFFLADIEKSNEKTPIDNGREIDIR
jgi:hypothetical protein